MLENAANFGTVLAAFAAVISFIWAVYLWKKQRSHDNLQDFRRDLSDFRAALQIFNENTGDLSAIEAGNHAALWILNVSGSKSGEDLRNFLNSCDKTEVFLGALVHGHQQSGLFQKKVRARENVQLSVGRHNEKFPVTNRLLLTVSYFLARTSDIRTRARIASDLIEKEILLERLLSNIEDGFDKGMLFSVLSDNFSQIGALGTPQHIEIVRITEEFMEIIVSNYLEMSDKQLNKASQYEKKVKHNVKESDTFTGDIESLSIIYENIVSKSDWTRLVELRTELKGIFA